jgi:hypothetical protein
VLPPGEEARGDLPMNPLADAEFVQFDPPIEQAGGPGEDV